jgi:hypothetical protein
MSIFITSFQEVSDVILSYPLIEKYTGFLYALLWGRNEDGSM